jgi:hypothetical protein
MYEKAIFAILRSVLLPIIKMGSMIFAVEKL